MSCREGARSALLLASLIVLTLPNAGAQANAAFDPLVFDFEGFLTTAGAVARSAPDAGVVAFRPISLASPAESLRFELASPIRFAAGGGFEITLVVRADAPVVARDADGNALEVSIEANGTAVDGASARGALGNGVLAPGAVETLSLRLQAPSAVFDEGARLAVVVRPLMPALAENALVLLVGGDRPSTLDMPRMRAPSASDLRLQESALTEFVLDAEDFRPSRPDAAVIDVIVGHGEIRIASALRYEPNGTYVVVRGVEDPVDAAAHVTLDREARVEAAHELRVGGVRVRAHPGLGVVVPVSSAGATIQCARNCPLLNVAVGGEPLVVPERSVLVPPPRDTRGIPTSEDEPDGQKETPMPALAALLALGIMAWTRKRE